MPGAVGVAAAKENEKVLPGISERAPSYLFAF